MKTRMMIAALAGLGLAASCVTDDADDVSAEAQQQLGAAPVAPNYRGPEWYYTCSDELLACSPGYGAVEWTYYPECIPYGASHRVKCQRGAIDP